MRNKNPFPDELYNKIQEVICRPEGTVSFRYMCNELFEPFEGRGILTNIVSKGHIFRIERDKDLLLYFFHSSPGTGTRVASIDLKKIKPVEIVFLAFSWSPKEIQFHFGPQVAGGKLLSSKGVRSKRQLRVGANGTVYELGSLGITIMNTTIFKNGKLELQPTAIEAWSETIKAIEILNTGKSESGNDFEKVVTNLTLVILVTGFEAYTKRRFEEIEQEGITPDIRGLLNMYSKKEKESGVEDRINEKSKELKRTILQTIIKVKPINFQNYKECMQAYKKAYGINFNNIKIASKSIEKIKKTIFFRHRIIHFSALVGMLNQQDVPPEEPIFSTSEYAKDIINEFQNFISKLHEASLNLKRGN